MLGNRHEEQEFANLGSEQWDPETRTDPEPGNGGFPKKESPFPFGSIFRF